MRTKRIAKKRRVKKVSKKLQIPLFRGFEMISNQDKESVILNPWDKDLLERRKDLIAKRRALNEEILRTTGQITAGIILSVEDMPQGTQLVKMINNDKFLKFHYC